MNDDRTAKGTSERHEFSIALPNLVAILGDALYSSWEVAVRELVQNAHDAIQRMDPPNNEPLITIECNSITKILTIEDNGEGMTREQVLNQLSTIGSGASVEYRNRLKQGGRRDEANKVIGQFGIGLLASFLLGERIEIETRSIRGKPNDAILWVSHGGTNYTITNIRKDRVGTRVIIRLGLGNDEVTSGSLPIQYRRVVALEQLAKPGAIEGVVRQYCQLLPIPIRCGKRQINETTLPWNSTTEDVVACRRFLEQRFGEEIGHVIPIPEIECQSLFGGALYVPTNLVRAESKSRRLDLFLQRMYVGETFADLLPEWARFLSGVINAWELAPTLDREDVRRDPAFFHGRRMIEDAIRKSLLREAAGEPLRFREFVSRHSSILKTVVAGMPTDLAKCIAPEITFETVGGVYSLREILERQKPRDNRTVLYFDGAVREIRRDLLEGLVDISYIVMIKEPDDERALQACEKLDELIRLQKYVVEAQHILPPAEGARWRELEGFVAKRLQIPVEACAFKNPAIPALVLMRRMSEAQCGTFNTLVGYHNSSDEIEKRLSGSPVNEGSREYLFVNCNCDLIQMMADHLHEFRVDALSVEAMSLIIEEIWNTAQLVSGKDVLPAQIYRMFANLRNLGQHLLNLTDREESVVNDPVKAHLVKLRRILAELFDEGELRTLCFDLDVDYEDLAGQRKGEKARELVRHLHNRARIVELVAVGKKLRPNAIWDLD